MDLKLLKHAVINQIEADCNAEDYDALDELLEKLIENGQQEVLHAYLSDTSQQNLKEGLTVKRWED